MSGEPIEIAPGLCSITLRQLGADAVLDAAVTAGVAGIEWGSDVHVPVGDHEAATRIARRCADVGIEVVSYGTYLGTSGDGDAELDAVARATFDTAVALGAPMARIWTAFGVTPDSPAVDRARVVDRTARMLEAAAERNLVLALEFHPHTHTHDAAGANALFDAVGDDALRSHWQPDPNLSPEDALAELDRIAARLAHLHVFAWGPGGIGDRQPLADGAALWPAALARARSVALPPGIDRRFALCEYVVDDDPDQLTADLAALTRWIAAGAGAEASTPDRRPPPP